jgi:hypothetical protein
MANRANHGTEPFRPAGKSVSLLESLIFSVAKHVDGEAIDESMSGISSEIHNRRE